MMVLDTNVISELMRNLCDENVRSWFLRHEARTIFTTAVSEAEIFYGIALMPAGQRRSETERRGTEIFETEFKGRILPFDEKAAREYAGIAASKRKAGKPITALDAQIAAIAAAHGAALATRNERDFAGCGITVVNPWMIRYQKTGIRDQKLSDT